MSSARPLDNENPTVLNPTQASSTLTASARAFNLPSGTSTKAKLASLWEGVGLTEWQDGAPDLVRDPSDDEDEREEIDAQEVFDLIRSITDPEHPLTLEQLAVVSSAQIKVYNPPRKASSSRTGKVTELNASIANQDGTQLDRDDDAGGEDSAVGQMKVETETDVDGGEDARILVEFTPTIPHCSMSTLIGLSLRVRLMRALPPRYKVDIRLKEGSHQSENAVNKQLNDKERVHAALENTHLLGVVEGCLASAHMRGVGNVGDDAH